MEWYWVLLIVLASVIGGLLIISIFYKWFFKRFFDIVLSLLSIIVLSPLLLVLFILIRIKLGKPAFFKQVRPGKNGKLFTLYKFRSMSNKTDENGKLLPDEQRLTKFGKGLRRSSLDELPELFNILFGHMSLIGPRPQLVKDFVFFDEETMKRQQVRPGLSGLAQVKGRNNISWEDKFKWDLKYCEKITFFKDLKILFMTIGKAFIKKEGINKEGFVTDEDYGDYLLRTNQIKQEQYNEAISRSVALIEMRELKHNV